MIHSRLADWVLACAVAPADREAAVGDLAEEYTIRLRRGSPVRAACWYWSQVLRSVPWFLWTPVRRSGWLGTLSVALAACLIQAGIEVLAAVTIRWLFAPDLTVAVLLGLAVVLSSLFFVAYLAARMRPGAGTLLTLIAIVAVLAQSISRGLVGLSFGRLAAMIAAPSAAFAGAALSLRVQRRLEAE
jgi:hypothetical protein